MTKFSAFARSIVATEEGQRSAVLGMVFSFKDGAAGLTLGAIDKHIADAAAYAKEIGAEWGKNDGQKFRRIIGAARVLSIPRDGLNSPMIDKGTALRDAMDKARKAAVAADNRRVLSDLQTEQMRGNYLQAISDAVETYVAAHAANAETSADARYVALRLLTEDGIMTWVASAYDAAPARAKRDEHIAALARAKAKAEAEAEAKAKEPVAPVAPVAPAPVADDATALAGAAPVAPAAPAAPVAPAAPAAPAAPVKGKGQAPQITVTRSGVSVVAAPMPGLDRSVQEEPAIKTEPEAKRAIAQLVAWAIRSNIKPEAIVAEIKTQYALQAKKRAENNAPAAGDLPGDVA